MKEVKISSFRKIVVKKTKYRGQDRLDIRTYLETPTFTGYTRKGINIPIENAEELARAILAELEEE